MTTTATADDLRVLLDCSALADGRATAGIGRYVRHLGAGLGAVPGVAVRRASPRRPPPRDSWAVRFLNAQPALARAALGFRPHLLHAPASDPALVWPASRQVVTVHDVIPWTTADVPAGSPTARYLSVQRRRIRRCAAVIAVSDTVAAQVCEVLRVPAPRVHVVPEGIDPVFTPSQPAGEAARLEAAGVPREGFALWVGSLRAHDPRKALDLLVDAVAALDPPCPLVLAGAAGAEAERVRTRATAAGLRVVVTGYVPDATLAALYRAAAVVAYPSTAEGFGLPLLEALACGAPVVSTLAGPLPALAGDAAVLVAPGDRGALTDALRRVLDDGVESTRLRAAGPRRAAPYTWERTVRLTVSVYEAAAGRALPDRVSPPSTE